MAFKANNPECATCTCGGVATQICGRCAVPMTITCVWRYRSYVYPGTGPCACGSVVTSIRFPLTAISPTIWVSDYLRIDDHDWGTCKTSGYGIPGGGWTRLEILCTRSTTTTASFDLYHATTATRPAPCLPHDASFGCSNLGRYANRAGVFASSCTPFLADTYDADGSSYNEDPGHFFDKWDFSA